MLIPSFTLFITACTNFLSSHNTSMISLLTNFCLWLQRQSSRLWKVYYLLWSEVKWSTWLANHYQLLKSSIIGYQGHVFSTVALDITFSGSSWLGISTWNHYEDTNLFILVVIFQLAFCVMINTLSSNHITPLSFTSRQVWVDGSWSDWQ